MQLDKHRVGTALGLTSSIASIAWLLVIVLGLGQTYIELVVKFHRISFPFVILGGGIGWLLLHILVMSVGGYVGGWIFAAIYNKLGKKE